jgi:hypothetical protein
MSSYVLGVVMTSLYNACTRESESRTLTGVWRCHKLQSMNDNTSNTPDNASRPGKTARPRDEHGRFLSKKEIEVLNNASSLRDSTPEPGSVEEALNQPLAGANNEITVGEYLKLSHEFSKKDPILGEIFRDAETTERRPTRIGQHVDVPNKTANGYTRHAKVSRKENKPSDSRRTLLYQIRTLPGNRGYGLYYADGLDFDHSARQSSTIIKHWFAENGYQATDAGAAKVFSDPDEARKFRREHFNVKVDDVSVVSTRFARQARFRAFRAFKIMKRKPSHTTSKKIRDRT